MPDAADRPRRRVAARAALAPGGGDAGRPGGARARGRRPGDDRQAGPGLHQPPLRAGAPTCRSSRARSWRTRSPRRRWTARRARSSCATSSSTCGSRRSRRRSPTTSATTTRRCSTRSRGRRRSSCGRSWRSIRSTPSRRGSRAGCSASAATGSGSRRTRRRGRCSRSTTTGAPFEKAAPHFDARVWVGGDLALEAPFRAADAAAAARPPCRRRGCSRSRTATLTFQLEGSGTLFYEARLRYARKDLPHDTIDRGLLRAQARAVGDAGRAARRARGAPCRRPRRRVRAGDLVLVDLVLVTPTPREQVVLDDPLAAGLEPVDASLATTAQSLDVADSGGEGDADDAAQTDDDARASGRGWAEAWFHREMHDDRVLTFVEHMPAGMYHYRYLARATTPGKFVVPPTKAECMYDPGRLRADGRDGARGGGAVTPSVGRIAASGPWRTADREGRSRSSRSSRSRASSGSSAGRRRCRCRRSSRAGSGAESVRFVDRDGRMLREVRADDATRARDGAPRRGERRPRARRARGRGPALLRAPRRRRRGRRARGVVGRGARARRVGGVDADDAARAPGAAASPERWPASSTRRRSRCASRRRSRSTTSSSST